MKWNAQLYTAKHSFVYEYGTEVINLLNPQAGEVILDLGCGSGQLTNEISRSGAIVVGIDKSPEMITAAREEFTAIDFRVMDAERLDFDFQFDAIFSNAAFHWIKNPEKAVAEISRNLTKGGRIVLEFGGKGNVKSIYETVKNLLVEEGLSFDDFWYFPSIGEFATLLEQYGFTVKFAHFFARETELSGDENAIIEWIEMFGDNFFQQTNDTTKRRILNETKTILRPTHYRNGKWFAYYKRIRVSATK